MVASVAGQHLSETTIGLMLLHVIKLLLPYLAAAFVFPEQLPEEGNVDLFVHYDRTRFFTYGALIAGLVLFWIARAIDRFATVGGVNMGVELANGPWVFVALYLVLVFVRLRWLNILLLTGGLLYYGWEIVGVGLHE